MVKGSWGGAGGKLRKRRKGRRGKRDGGEKETNGKSESRPGFAVEGVGVGDGVNVGTSYMLRNRK